MVPDETKNELFQLFIRSILRIRTNMDHVHLHIIELIDHGGVVDRIHVAHDVEFTLHQVECGVQRSNRIDQHISVGATRNGTILDVPEYAHWPLHRLSIVDTVMIELNKILL